MEPQTIQSLYTPWLLGVIWGASVAILAIQYVLLRSLPFGRFEEPIRTELPTSLGFTLERLDYISLSIIVGMVVLMWIGHNSLCALPPDGYYHLTVARQILNTGTIPVWNTWEFAPVGRPHLYPPLFHLILAGVAKLYHGDLLAAYRFCQTFALPFAHLCVWWLTRWLFGSRRAFFTLLLLGCDIYFALVGYMATPSLLAGAFAVLMLLFFLSGYVGFAALFGALSAYAHLSVLPMTLLGLGLFCLWQRAYGRRLVTLFILVFLMSAPWNVWLFIHRDVFKHPIDLMLSEIYGPWMRTFLKIVWSHALNILLCYLVFRSMRLLRWRDPANRLALTSALGFLPMLFSHGGRYFSQSVPFWCMLAAGGFAYADWRSVTKRGRIAFAIILLLPTPVLVGYGIQLPIGPLPMPSAWCVPPAIALGGMRVLNNGSWLVPYEDLLHATEYIRSNTDPNEIVFIADDAGRDLSITLAFYTQRRIDKGAWEETQPSADMMAFLRDRARNYHGKACYITLKETDLPPDTSKTQFGKLWVGLRNTPSVNISRLPDRSNNTF